MMPGFRPVRSFFAFFDFSCRILRAEGAGKSAEPTLR